MKSRVLFAVIGFVLGIGVGVPAGALLYRLYRPAESYWMLPRPGP